MENQNNIIIRVATPDDVHYAIAITDEMEESAKARGTGIAKRSPEYVAEKINEGKAVIAVTKDGAKTSLNGWNYWEVQLPGSAKWRSIGSMLPARRR